MVIGTASIRPSPSSSAGWTPRFLRIHRSALVNVDWIQEINSWFAGKVILSLKDPQHTQIPVARDRVRSLKSRLGI
jgi:DNA-binding LytR/AlgR family response regulator